MPWRVTKISMPGWEHDFNMRSNAVTVLKSNICQECLNSLSNADDPWLLLGTGCGREYNFEEIDPH